MLAFPWSDSIPSSSPWLSSEPCGEAVKNIRKSSLPSQPTTFFISSGGPASIGVDEKRMCSRMMSSGGESSQGTSRCRPRHSLFIRQPQTGSQVKPPSSTDIRRLGQTLKTPSLMMLVIWEANDAHSAAYCSMKYDAYPVEDGGPSLVPPMCRPATRS